MKNRIVLVTAEQRNYLRQLSGKKGNAENDIYMVLYEYKNSENKYHLHELFAQYREWYDFNESLDFQDVDESTLVKICKDHWEKNYSVCKNITDLRWEYGETIGEIMNEITINHFKDMLLYQRIVKLEKCFDNIFFATLSNGKILYFRGNEGSGWNGDYELTDLATDLPDNVITNVKVEVTEYDSDDCPSKISVFLFYENKKINLASYEGNDNGYYGTGFWVSVITEKEYKAYKEGKEWASE